VREGSLTLLEARGDRDHASGTPSPRELDGHRADTAARTEHRDRLARTQLAGGAQEMPRSGSLDDQSKRLLVGDAVSDRERQVKRGGDPLGVAAAPRN